MPHVVLEPLRRSEVCAGRGRRQLFGLVEGGGGIGRRGGLPQPPPPRLEELARAVGTARSPLQHLALVARVGAGCAQKDDGHGRVVVGEPVGARLRRRRLVCGAVDALTVHQGLEHCHSHLQRLGQALHQQRARLDDLWVDEEPPSLIRLLHDREVEARARLVLIDAVHGARFCRRCGPGRTHSSPDAALRRLCFGARSQSGAVRPRARDRLRARRCRIVDLGVVAAVGLKKTFVRNHQLPTFAGRLHVPVVVRARVERRCNQAAQLAAPLRRAANQARGGEVGGAQAGAAPVHMADVLVRLVELACACAGRTGK